MPQFAQEPSVGIIAQEVSSDLMYDDGPISINDAVVFYKNFNQISAYRLDQMIKRFPAMKKSWEAFIIDYNVCLATIHAEENMDDIPF